MKYFLERFVNISKRRKELFGKYQKFTKLCNDAKGIVKEDYGVHVFFAKNATDADPFDLQHFWEMYKKKVLDWWSLFYIDRENEIIDDKKKGFIVFNKEELQKIEAC